MNDVKKIIETLELVPHVEGGYYRRIYIAEKQIAVNESVKRPLCTAIYYLLESGDFSCWHRLQSDEIWHHYVGSSLTIRTLTADGELQELLLGNPLEDPNARPFRLVPNGCWFTATVNDPESFTLVGANVMPGFHPDDCELGERRQLLAAFPQHAELITRFTREDQQQFESTNQSLENGA